MTKAENARFQAFLKATEQEERDWIAFCEFEQAVDEVTHCASLVNPFDDSDNFERERGGMKPAVWEMLLRLLPKAGLGIVVTSTAELGYALKFGLVPATPQALDHITDNEAFRALLDKACEAENESRHRRDQEILEQIRRRDRRSARRRRTSPASQDPSSS
jgi:hypothetical protein